MNEKMESWTTCLVTLSNIAKVHLHMEYCAYTNKWTFWTILNISDLLQLLENAIFHHFVPALIGKPVSEMECALLALPVYLEGLGISDSWTITDSEP